MAKKYYVVWAGRNTGIFTSWAYTKKQVDKFPQARYKSFKTQQEAEAAYTAARSETSSTTTKKNKNKKKLNVPNKGEVEQIDLNIDHNANFDVKIFCDGACDPNPGEAGSGLAVYRGGKLAELWHGLYNAHGTNQPLVDQCRKQTYDPLVHCLQSQHGHSHAKPLLYLSGFCTTREIAE